MNKEKDNHIFNEKNKMIEYVIQSVMRTQEKNVFYPPQRIIIPISKMFHSK